jgi:hypothetical protein
VAQVVLGKSTWAVLALTCHIEIFTLVHYKKSIEPETNASELWKDVFLFHWKEESQHAVLDELEWRREDAKLAPAERDQAVTDLIDLVVAVDGILQAQKPGQRGRGGQPSCCTTVAAIFLCAAFKASGSALESER